MFIIILHSKFDTHTEYYPKMSEIEKFEPSEDTLKKGFEPDEGSLKKGFEPSEDTLEKIRYILENGSPCYPREYFDYLSAVPLEELMKSFRKFWTAVEPYQAKYKEFRGWRPLDEFYMDDFGSKERFLAHMAEISYWLFSDHLGALRSRDAMRLIMKHFPGSTYSFFNVFYD